VPFFDLLALRAVLLLQAALAFGEKTLHFARSLFRLGTRVDSRTHQVSLLLFGRAAELELHLAKFRVQLTQSLWGLAISRRLFLDEGLQEGGTRRKSAALEVWSTFNGALKAFWGQLLRTRSSSVQLLQLLEVLSTTAHLELRDRLLRLFSRRAPVAAQHGAALPVRIRVEGERSGSLFISRLFRATRSKGPHSWPLLLRVVAQVTCFD